MKSSNTMEAITIKEEPIDIDPPLGEEDGFVNCRQLCSAQYNEDAGSDKQSQPKADPLVKTEPSVKVEPPDNLDPSGTPIKDKVVEPPGTDNLYSAKCELICTAENDEDLNTEPQPTPSTSAASKAEDNFEFISVGAIKQEEPEWASEAEEADPNPLQEGSEQDQKQTLQQDDGPDFRYNTGHSRSVELECELIQERSRKSLLKHVRTHDAAERGVCKKAFSKLTYLNTRSRVHVGARPHRCGDCNMQFKSKAELVAHSRGHVGARLHRCGDCNVQFKSKAELVAHSRGHVGARPYRCGFCSKQFNRSGDLADHIRVHSGETPYHCVLCKEQFQDLSNLTAHNATHASEMFQCDVCYKEFKYFQNFNLHGKIHALKCAKK